MLKPRWYTLDGHTVVPTDDMLEAMKNHPHVAVTDIGDVHVSTVFLGLDHSFGRRGPPIVFETMIFGGEHDQYQERCSTWEEAQTMHARAVSMAKKAG